jgi:hypothetical protein
MLTNLKFYGVVEVTSGTIKIFCLGVVIISLIVINILGKHEQPSNPKLYSTSFGESIHHQRAYNNYKR